MKNKIVAIIIGVVVIGGGAFYGGMQYAKAGTPTRGANGARSAQFGGTAGGRNGQGGPGGFTGGQIIAKDDKSITVQSRDGSSKIVFVNTNTPVMKSVAGSVSDLKSGEQITVIGTANSDGSITADSLQIRPATSTPRGN